MDLRDLLATDSVKLKGERVFLRHPRYGDYKAWAALRGTSRDFLEPWEPRWSKDELTRGAWRKRMQQYNCERARGTGQTFLIFECASSALAGGISLINIRRGAAQCGHIGYWMGEVFASRGLMADALSRLVSHSFDELGLHRIEAACIPKNVRSSRVLEKAGFSREGLLRSYLKIDGKWQDHVLFSLIDEDYRGSKNQDEQN